MTTDTKAGYASAANAAQVGGSHYQLPIQPWDYIVSNGIGYLEGNVIKYVSRWKAKGGLEDLRKARHYLDKLIEVAEADERHRAHERGAAIIREAEDTFLRKQRHATSLDDLAAASLGAP